MSAKLALILTVLSATRRGRSDRRTLARLSASRSASLGSGLAAGRPRPSSPPAWFWPASWTSLSWRGSFDVEADRTPARTFAAHSCLAPAMWGFGLFGGFHSPLRASSQQEEGCVYVCE